MISKEFDEYKKQLIIKPIYDVIINDNNNRIEFNIGNSELCLNPRHTGDHNFNKYKKYVLNQECFIATFKSEIKVKIFGYWELQYNSKTLISRETKEDNVQEIFNVIFQGHKITDLKKHRDKIKIYFSNKMVLNIFNKNNRIEVISFIIYFGYKIFLFNEEGIIERMKRGNYLLKTDDKKNKLKKLCSGVFWILSDSYDLKGHKFLMFDIPCDSDGNPDNTHSIELNSKSGNSYNHKKLWENKIKNNNEHHPYNKKDYDYYPRGRVEISHNRATIYLNSNINKPSFIDEIKEEFGLSSNNISEICVKVDGSVHYQCFLDRHQENEL